jgi:hypothetical protein
MAANRPWLAMNVVVVPEAQHPLPKHPEKRLPKFDPDNDVTPKDNIKQFMLSLRLLDVQHEDVVCRLLYESQHYYMKFLISVPDKIKRISILERTIHMPRE